MPVAIDIQDVPMPSLEDPYRASETGTTQAWGSHFESDRTLVCLGSNRTMPASGRMLNEMFEIDHLADSAELPFRIVWGTNVYAQASRFRLDAQQIEDRYPMYAEQTRQGRASALVLRDHIFLDTLTAQKQGMGYGLCVAQRRANGAVWILIAGLSGPATFATACLLHRLPISLAESGSGACSPVSCSVVSATVPANRERPIESMRNLNPERVFGPTNWQGRS